LASRRLCRTLEKEWTKLIELKKQSLIRKIAVHEEDKGEIADIFERINRAREQLVVRIVIVFPVPLLIRSVEVVTGIRVHKTVLAIQEDVAVCNPTILNSTLRSFL